MRRWPVISAAACFAIALRGNCFRWERCLHAGGAVVQFCREIPVCWPQCFSTGFFCGLRYNPIRIQRLFLHTFSDKPDGTKLQTSEAFAIWRGRTTERTRPAACGGARNVEFVRTSRRRHSCGVAASTAVSAKWTKEPTPLQGAVQKHLRCGRKMFHMKHPPLCSCIYPAQEV